MADLKAKLPIFTPAWSPVTYDCPPRRLNSTSGSGRSLVTWAVSLRSALASRPVKGGVSGAACKAHPHPAAVAQSISLRDFADPPRWIFGVQFIKKRWWSRGAIIESPRLHDPFSRQIVCVPPLSLDGQIAAWLGHHTFVASRVTSSWPSLPPPHHRSVTHWEHEAPTHWRRCFRHPQSSVYAACSHVPSCHAHRSLSDRCLS